MEVIERDLYSIEMIDDRKEVHILHNFTDDLERAPFVRIDYTGCYVPLNDFISEVRNRDYRDYVTMLEEEVKQYEYEFNTIEEMLADTLGFLGGGDLTPLDYNEITEDTPCGLYITKTEIY